MHTITIHVADQRSAAEIAAWLREVCADVRQDGAGGIVAVDRTLSDAERAALPPLPRTRSQAAGHNVLPLRRPARRWPPSRPGRPGGDAA
ncbi:hypothetical protein [Marichromatium gracile]|uniref:Uncharacterized protein n=1 Tax=Marichromatium gracile TaxID=1048 RepID=A0A4R4A5C1_MARGR|nr:hypothetical protein [Marichromatium gracile]MBK1709828.1 hypothetical protein [Marichromatium gracile]TCW32660.1 hypothetical protein EDC29_11726 [Marichromatium gracile]